MCRLTQTFSGKVIKFDNGTFIAAPPEVRDILIESGEGVKGRRFGCGRQSSSKEQGFALIFRPVAKHV